MIASSKIAAEELYSVPSYSSSLATSTTPVVDYASEIRKANPRGVVAVYIPQYVVGRWWEQALHNQTALRLKTRLLFTPGVMVISVPYQLRSSVVAKERTRRDYERPHAGDLRSGRVRESPRGTTYGWDE